MGAEQKVVIITGASQGIGADLVNPHDIASINGASADQMKLFMSALALQGIDTQLSPDPNPVATLLKPDGPTPEVTSTGQLLVVRLALENGPAAPGAASL